MNGDSGWKKTNELNNLIQFVWFHHASHSFSEWKWLHEMNSSGLLAGPANGATRNSIECNHWNESLWFDLMQCSAIDWLNEFHSLNQIN